MSARLARPLEATKVSLNRLGLHSTQRTLQPTRLLRPTQRFYGTREESRRTAATFGPFTWKAATAFITTGAALLVYFDYEKKKSVKEREEKREQEKAKSYGKPKLGGHYQLTHANNGESFDSESLKGHFSMIYFGFTHCPDICPEELDKMAHVVTAVQTDKTFSENALVPIFITCDPRRDTVPVVKEYVKDFHPDLIGLTGSEQEIKKTAKLFRVYVSSPPSTEDGDYLVDHSIFFYLMSPEGVFLDCYSQNTTAEDVLESFKKHYHEYIAQGGELKTDPVLSH